MPTVGRKKKNNITGTKKENLFSIEPFFSLVSTESKTAADNPKAPSPTTPPPAQQVTPQQPTAPVQQHVRLKSTEMPGVSIKNLLNNDSQNKEKEAAQQESTLHAEETNEFSQNDLILHWKEYIQSIPEKKLLITTMQSCLPVVKENYYIEVVVDNPVQEKEMISERNDLIAFLSKKLQNGKIHIYVRINEQGENKKSLSPQERFRSMLERNPNMEYLRSELELEIN